MDDDAPTPAVRPDTEADRKLIEAVALDIGKELVAHVEVMYPDAFARLGKSGRLRLRLERRAKHRARVRQQTRAARR